MKMDAKKRNRLLSLAGGLVGAIVGYFYPWFVQGFLPILGIGAGLFYFFGANSVNKDPDKRKVTDFNEFTWYSILRVAMGFLVGSAIVSTIVLTMDILEQQNQQSLFWNYFI
ncbi:MAG TPA: hypothetical protein VK048_00200 [Atopostipes sp.]|nr:hypothetical protein [Atopostipes sp.]